MIRPTSTSRLTPWNRFTMSWILQYSKRAFINYGRGWGMRRNDSCIYKCLCPSVVVWPFFRTPLRNTHFLSCPPSQVLYKITSKAHKSVRFSAFFFSCPHLTDLYFFSCPPWWTLIFFHAPPPLLLNPLPPYLLKAPYYSTPYYT